MKSRYAKIESIDPSGNSGMYMSMISVRENLFDTFHGLAITCIGKDLTECVERSNIILKAFNEAEK